MLIFHECKSYLPRKPVNMAYVSLTRTHFKYCSEPLLPGSHWPITYLMKLNVVQKRQDSGWTRTVEFLHIQPLDVRRSQHSYLLMTSVTWRVVSCHLSFVNLLTESETWSLTLGSPMTTSDTETDLKLITLH